MSQFDDRLNAFEAKFAQDESLKFKLQAQRDKQFALWVADKIGKPASEQEAYSRDVISASLEAPGDDDILHKVSQDFEAAGQSISRDALSAKLKAVEAEVRQRFIQALEKGDEE